MVERGLRWLAGAGDRVVDQLGGWLGLVGIILVGLLVLAALMRHFFPGGYRW
jgi:hypothetical protein